MLQGWSLLAAIAGGAWLLSKSPTSAPLSEWRGGIGPVPPVRDPGGRIDPGAVDPGHIMVVRGTGPRQTDGWTPPPPPPPAPESGLPRPTTVTQMREQGWTPEQARAAGVDASAIMQVWGSPVVGPTSGPAQSGAGLWRATPIVWQPATDPNNAAHATSTAFRPRAVDPVAIARGSAANATPATLVKTPDASTPPALGGGWGLSDGPVAGRGAMPWDASHIPVVQAVAPPPAALSSRTLPMPSLGPQSAGTGRHIPPPPPVAADPTGPTRTTLLPWDHPIAGPRMPQLTGTRVPITDAPRGAATWYGTPAAAPGVLSSAAGLDPSVRKPPTLLQTIAQLVAPAAGRPSNPLGRWSPSSVSGPVAGSLPRASAPW